MLRSLLALFLLLAAAAAAEPTLVGTWVGAKPAFAADATVVVAVFDRTGTCCGGPAAALSALAGLRDSLAARPGIMLVAVDSTPGVTGETARTAAAAHALAGLPLLADPERASGTALGAEAGVTISYVVVKPDGGRVTCASPAKVRRELGL